MKFFDMKNQQHQKYLMYLIIGVGVGVVLAEVLWIIAIVGFIAWFWYNKNRLPQTSPDKK